MKVLQVGKYYPPYWGGMETAVKDISECLSNEVEMEVLVANSDSHCVEEVQHGVSIMRLLNIHTLFSQPITPGLFGELRRRQVDIVHLHEPNPLALACFLASGNPAKLVIHYHSDIVRQKTLMHFYRPILERGLERAEIIIVGSPHLIESSPILSKWRRKCVVVPFGIDLDPFLELPRIVRPQSPVQVLAVGRLSYYKGFHHLIEAVREMDVRLVIAGDGELRQPLEQQVRECGLAARVRFAGRIPQAELLSLYAGSDIFCLPSCERSEAFGLAMVEGMAAGLPVVSTDLPTGVRLVNQHGSTGLVVPPADSAALARAIMTLAGDANLRVELGVAARDRAKRLFSRDVMGRAILDIYRRLDSPAKPEEVLLH